MCSEGFPGGASGKEPSCQCRRGKRFGFTPWVRKIPCRRAWQPTPVCSMPWTQKPGGLQSKGSQRVRHNLATKQQQVLGIQWQIKQAPCPSGANSPTAQTDEPAVPVPCDRHCEVREHGVVRASQTHSTSDPENEFHQFTQN